ncbi:hypothetical protein [Endozoicomonas arenosclerae]|uniref:hypothetical protein n=1 Tax=Endozoicomonas arenosclerae TaxID=1633495 RepID=UPI0007812317|nr:hypothetical protein [Endozoicomonas arenosclerae]
MKKRIIQIFSWLTILWIAKVFLFSLPYKFTGHPDTQHIFGTIGQWMQGVIGVSIGEWFSSYGAIAVGMAELTVSLLLFFPIILFIKNKLGTGESKVSQSLIHTLGGLAASGIMVGAVFFHLATPLGIEVLHQGQSDGGSLFYAAASILVLGLMMAFANFTLLREEKLARATA